MKIDLIVLSVEILGLISAVYILIRNAMLYNFRINMIENNFEEYLKLPSYDRMVLSFRSFKSFKVK